jgi:hypothetical protein
MLLVLLVGLASAGVVREAERSTRALKPGRDRTEVGTEDTQRPTARKRGPSVLLTGPFGGLTDDVREFLDLPDAAQLGFVFAAWWEGVDWGDWAPQAELGRVLWHERDTLLQELAGLPPGQQLAGFARRFRVLVGHRWPSMLAAAAMSGPEPPPSLAVATAN